MLGQHKRVASGQDYYPVENVDLSARRKVLDMGVGATSYNIVLCSASFALRKILTYYPVRKACTIVHNV